ncbi:hypothetical protein M3665_24205, partial [Bacillus licheniformis]|nr:hypothetical protein [Bacillus licheniformis]
MMMKRMLALAVVAAAAVAGGVAAGHWFRGTADDGVAVAAPTTHGNPVEQLWASSLTGVDGKQATLTAFK